MSGKGGDFERLISKFLSVWLTGKAKPYQYWRMPGSGSLATIHEENVGLSGDIRALTPEAEFLTDYFSIECKTGYPKTTFWQHFKDIKNFNIKLFWQQCVNDARKASKEPMLIYRKKGTKPVVGIPYNVDGFFKWIGIGGIRDINSIMIRFKENDLPALVLYDMNDFFSKVKPDDMWRLM